MPEVNYGLNLLTGQNVKYIYTISFYCWTAHSRVYNAAQQTVMPPALQCSVWQ